jgi:hypothetical protein
MFLRDRSRNCVRQLAMALNPVTPAGLWLIVTLKLQCHIESAPGRQVIYRRTRFSGQIFGRNLPRALFPAKSNNLESSASMDFRPMLPLPHGVCAGLGRSFSTRWVADFYMGPSNDAARLSVPPTCPCRPIHCQPTRTRSCTGQTTATSRITRFSWQQPHMRLIANAASTI